MAEKKDIEDAVKITAILVRDSTKSWYLDCEGDLEWFPKAICNFDSVKNTLEVLEWFLKKLGWKY